MNELLKPGQKVHTELSGMLCEVEQFLGGGGQGEVYQAKLSGKPVALKWYFRATATADQRKAIDTLVKIGPPNEKFLWPMDVATEPTVPGFGYIMPLRPSQYKGIVDLMKRRVDPSFRALATAGLNVAHNFLQLHSKGLCYRDISFGNVFFDPANGDVLICDNDNVAVEGQVAVSILGTPRFMAPEVVRGEAKPSTRTDLFSLSVLLFYMLIIHHPLEGRKEAAIHAFDLPAMTKLYGTEPLFIFDPSDRSNEPVPGYHDNAIVFWPIYPLFLRNLFTKAFTDGIRDPENGRARESEWRAAMAQLRDSIFYCSHCGSQNFYDADGLRASGGQSGRCWSCKRQLRLPPRIRIGRNVVMLNHDTELFPHHVDNTRLYDFSKPIAAVTRHPTDPNVWGIKNLGSDRWVATTSDGRVNDVEPGHSVMLASGTRIQFGKTDGEIRA